MHRFILDRLKRYAVYQPPFRMETCLSRLIRGVPRGGEGERSKSGFQIQHYSQRSSHMPCPYAGAISVGGLCTFTGIFLLYRKFFEKQIQEICLN
jgi:hypothetical protein